MKTEGKMSICRLNGELTSTARCDSFQLAVGIDGQGFIKLKITEHNGAIEIRVGGDRELKIAPISANAIRIHA